ncbi:aspartate kinase [bacterium]|nr:aspartate kinase [bacterium]
MIVSKFGGSSLRDAAGCAAIADIICEKNSGDAVIVLSALQGVTDRLAQAVSASLDNWESAELIRADIECLHATIAGECIKRDDIRSEVLSAVSAVLARLGRLLRGVGYTGEATPRVKDEIMSMGERLCVRIMAGLISDRGVPVTWYDGDAIPLIARGEWGCGSGDIAGIREGLPPVFASRGRDDGPVLVTGYFGRRASGEALTFGRGGSDYVAALLADALQAEKLEIWKDVDGFLSGSPEMIDDTRFIERLSYDEAAELAYFGANILHPRTVEPLLDRSVPIEIKNTFRPQRRGTWIAARGEVSSGIVKSVTCDRNVALLRIHGPDVGYTIGLLSTLVTTLAGRSINIRSVMTSQTCINILLDRPDLDTACRMLTSLHPEGIDIIEPEADIGLVAVVGQGLLESRHCLSDIMTSLYESAVHVEMIISGASKVAAYIIVPLHEMEASVRIVHNIMLAKQRAGEGVACE